MASGSGSGSGSGPSDEEDEFLSVSENEEVEELIADVSGPEDLMAIHSIIHAMTA